jgi:RNA polymerase sigma-70 factor, ECF subfamily
MDAAANGETVQPTLGEADLAELYELYGGRLLHLLVKLCNGDRGKAEDILQETFVRAWRNPHAISTGPSCWRWLCTVARRIAIDHFRMVGARPKEVAQETPEDRIPAHDPYDAVLESRDIEVALAELTPHQREVLVELHLRDRSVNEAARVLGVPAGTVKSRHYHAVRALRSVLEAAGMDAVA